MIPYDQAHAFLVRDFDQHLSLLGALEYEPVHSVHGASHAGALAALALVVEPDPVPDSLPTVMVTATASEALGALIRQEAWPAPAVWTTPHAYLLPHLEQALGAAHDPLRGSRYYIARTEPQCTNPDARRLTLADADALDLAPCSLSPTALRNWIKRGWHAFGLVRDGALWCHALAAYSLGDTDEVAALFTAPQVRRHGYASAVVAATIADIAGRGRRAVYAFRRTNHASQGVAETLGLVPLLETWEIVR